MEILYKINNYWAKWRIRTAYCLSFCKNLLSTSLKIKIKVDLELVGEVMIY